MVRTRTRERVAEALATAAVPDDTLVDALADDLVQDGAGTTIGGETQGGGTPPWSARVVASTGGAHLAAEQKRPDEWAAGNFTDALTDLMEDDPSLSLDDALDIVVDMDLSHDRGPQMPTEFAVGDGRTDKASRKYALILANGDYDQDAAKAAGFESISDLAAKGDANAMASVLVTRGFDLDRFGVYTDQTGAEMRSLMMQAVEHPRLRAGDVLVIHYSGHGLRSAGMIGVDANEVQNSFLATLPSIARARGVQLRLILDACHSGATAAASRDAHNRVENLAAKETKKAERVALYKHLEALRQFSRRLRRACLDATRSYVQDLAESMGGAAGRAKVTEATRVKFGDGGDVNLDRVTDLMEMWPQGVSQWWQDEGWPEVYFLLEPFEQAYPDLYFNLPNADRQVSYAQLQDALDDVLVKVTQRMGMEGTDFLKQQYAAAKKGGS